MNHDASVPKLHSLYCVATNATMDLVAGENKFRFDATTNALTAIDNHNETNNNNASIMIDIDRQYAIVKLLTTFDNEWSVRQAGACSLIQTDDSFIALHCHQARVLHPRDQLIYNSVAWEYRYETAIVVEISNGMQQQQPLSQLEEEEETPIATVVVAGTNDEYWMTQPDHQQQQPDTQQPETQQQQAAAVATLPQNNNGIDDDVDDDETTDEQPLLPPPPPPNHVNNNELYPLGLEAPTETDCTPAPSVAAAALPVTNASAALLFNATTTTSNGDEAIDNVDSDSSEDQQCNIVKPTKRKLVLTVAKQHQQHALEEQSMEIGHERATGEYSPSDARANETQQLDRAAANERPVELVLEAAAKQVNQQTSVDTERSDDQPTTHNEKQVEVLTHNDAAFDSSTGTSANIGKETIVADLLHSEDVSDRYQHPVETSSNKSSGVQVDESDSSDAVEAEVVKRTSGRKTNPKQVETDVSNEERRAAAVVKQATVYGSNKSPTEKGNSPLCSNDEMTGSDTADKRSVKPPSPKEAACKESNVTKEAKVAESKLTTPESSRRKRTIDESTPASGRRSARKLAKVESATKPFLFEVLVTKVKDFNGKHEQMIKALGGTLREIEDAKLATHVIADNPLGRSTKLMAALNVTPHVVNLAWLVDSAKAGKLLRLPNKKYSLLDKIRMDRIAANIENHTPLLKNVQVYVCSRVASYKAQNIKEKSTPKIEHFKSIVEAAGGEWRTNLATCSKLGIGKKLVIITSVERKKAAAQMAVKSVVAALKLEGVYQKTTDWLFDGMMEQTSIEF